MEATDGDSGVPEVQGAPEGQERPSAQEAGVTGVAAPRRWAGRQDAARGQDTAGGSSLAEVGRGVATRASDRERDAVVQRVQDAFAEGRLDDTEFDERTRAALTARTHAELDALLADLPAATAAAAPPPRLPAAAPAGSPSR